MSKMFQWVIAILLLALVAVNVWLVCTIRCHGAMCNGQKPMGSNMMTVPGAKQDSIITYHGNLSTMYLNKWTSLGAIPQAGSPIMFKDDSLGSGMLPTPYGPDTSVWICAWTNGAVAFTGHYYKGTDSIYAASNNSYPANTLFFYWIQ